MRAVEVLKWNHPNKGLGSEENKRGGKEKMFLALIQGDRTSYGVDDTTYGELVLPIVDGGSVIEREKFHFIASGDCGTYGTFILCVGVYDTEEKAEAAAREAIKMIR